MISPSTHFLHKRAKKALKDKKNSTPGANSVHYEMLKQLPERKKFMLLKLIKSLETLELPDAW